MRLATPPRHCQIQITTEVIPDEVIPEKGDVHRTAQARHAREFQQQVYHAAPSSSLRHHLRSLVA